MLLPILSLGFGLRCDTIFSRDVCVCVCFCLCVVTFPSSHKTRMNQKNPSMFTRFRVPAACSLFPFGILVECVRVSVKNDVLFHLGIPCTASSSSDSLLFSTPVTFPFSLSSLFTAFFFSPASARYFQICHILIAINLAIE